MPCTPPGDGFTRWQVLAEMLSCQELIEPESPRVGRAATDDRWASVSHVYNRDSSFPVWVVLGHVIISSVLVARSGGNIDIDSGKSWCFGHDRTIGEKIERQNPEKKTRKPRGFSTKTRSFVNARTCCHSSTSTSTPDPEDVKASTLI